MDQSEYLALFISEGKEHLLKAENILQNAQTSLTLEQSAVDEFFRQIHSLKGMAAAMAFEATSNLAHHYENLISKLRDGSLSLSKDMIDVLFKCLDVLQNDLDNIANKTTIADHTDLIEALNVFSQSQQTQHDQSQYPAHLPNTETDYHDIDIQFKDSCATPSVRAFMLHKRFSQLSEDVFSIPSLTAIRSGDVQNSCNFFLPLEINADKIKEIIESIVEIETFTINKILSTKLAERLQPPRMSKQLFSLLQTQKDLTSTIPTTTPESSIRVSTEVLDNIVDGLGDIFISQERLRVLTRKVGDPELVSHSDQMHRHIRHLYERVISIRMTPLKHLTDKLHRTVRELNRQLNKETKLEISGQEVEADRAVLEALEAPVQQIIRNCLDHGIESPEDRKKTNKEPAGTISINAWRERGSIMLSIADDGKGINPTDLKRKALEKEIIDQATADKLDDRSALFLICLPGFSTASEVTEVSGRGVGMDVVQAQLERLGGRLEIDSIIGKGTNFTLSLPLTLSITNALIIHLGGQQYAIPTHRIMGTTITKFSKQKTVITKFRGEKVVVYSLQELLGYPLTDSNEERPAVIIEEDGTPVAFLVDHIEGSKELVVKPIGEMLSMLEWFTGASILDTGLPVLIVDLAKTLRFQQKQQP